MSQPARGQGLTSAAARPWAVENAQRGVHKYLTSPIGVVVLAVAVRIPALRYAAAIDDEKVYAVVANELLHGGLLYRSAIERKPPLLFWIYEAVFAAAGRVDFVWLHSVAALWVLGTMLGLYYGVRTRCGRSTATAAAMLYGVFSAAAEYKNLAANGELLMNLPLVWAWALVLCSEGRVRARALLLAGALLAAAVLIKQPAGAGAVALGLYMLTPSYRRARGLTVHWQVGQLAVLGLGALLPIACVAAVLQRQGVLQEALYWSIGDHDVPHGPTDPIFWQRAWGGAGWFFASCAPLTILVVLALGSRREREPDTHKHGQVLLLLCSLIGASASGRFYTHYFLQALPAMSWLGAVTLVQLRERPRAGSWDKLLSQLLHTAIFVCAVSFTVLGARALGRPLEVGATASYVARHTAPEDRIFVWGQSSGFYLQAQRRPASRFINVFPLTGYIFGSPLGLDPTYDTRARILPGAWDQLARDFAAQPPCFIVDTDTPSAHPKYSPLAYPQLAQLLREHYVWRFASSDGIAYRSRDAGCRD